MSVIISIIRELEERAVAQAVGRKYDDARISFPLFSNRVSSEAEFNQVLGDFYNHMHSQCVASGATLPAHEALGRANSLLEEKLRQDGLNMRSAYHNALEGLNGGVMALLDIIKNAMRKEAQYHYTDAVLRKYISPMEWEQQVDAIRSLLGHFRSELPSDIDVNHPEKYAHDYSRLIKGLVYRVNDTAKEFRRY